MARAAPRKDARMLHPEHHRKTYSNDDIERLCQISGFIPDDISGFKETLESIAATYRWEAAKHTDIPRSSAIARDLKSLIRRVKRLELGLNELPEEAAHHLNVAIERNNSTDFARAITGALPDSEPSLTVALPDEAGPLIALDIEISEVLQMLSGLERAALDAIDSLPQRGRGQPRDHALRLWMSNIKLIWERNTSAPFTRDETSSGELITPAARFCVAAFHCISPDYPVTRIMWEMRACIHRTK